MTDFNPLNHPILFVVPERLTPFSFWHEHIPFAMLLVDLLRPRAIVELGSHYGDSYCAFCQAVSELKTETGCYAVDNWSGDIHYGEYGPEVLEDLKKHHDPRYAGFSTLIKSAFDDALANFEDGSIDLLHIDGTHTYEAVKHDFDNWRPKMSASGVVILHDTNVREGVFGVRQFFDELTERYPNFEFLHCYGLGVLATGSEPPESLKWLFEASPAEADRIRAMFHTLGQLHRIKATVVPQEEALRKLMAGQEALMEEKEGLLSTLKTRLADADAEAKAVTDRMHEMQSTMQSNIQALTDRMHEMQSTIQALKDQLYEISTSTGWALLLKLWRLKGLLKSVMHPFGYGLKRLNRSARKLEDPSLLLNLDSIRVGKSGAFIAEGWVFSRDRAISNVRLVVENTAGKRSFECKYGLPRHDVKRAHKLPQALHSGFSALGNLEDRPINSITLKVGYADGQTESVSLPVRHVRFLGQGSIDSGEAGLDAPFSSFRGFLTSAALSDSRQFSVVFDHNVGGGANYYRSRLIEQLVRQGKEVLLVYYDLEGLEYIVEHVSKNGSRATQIGSINSLAGIASVVKIADIFINNLYSYEDPLGAVRSILNLKKLTKAKLTMAAHDYMCVCPEFNLVDKDERFCGIPDVEVCNKCLPENRSEILRYIHHKNMNEWRRVWGEILTETDEILCFSNSTISLIKRAYPDLPSDKLKYVPHVVDYLPDHKPALDLSQGLHIGVVGTIMRNKGSRVVEEMAELIAQNKLPAKLTVIGSIFTDCPLPGVEITGNYRREELPELIERHGVNLCMLPSIWPETFSYVAEELMLLDVPLAVFNLGAPAERVSLYPKGLVLDRAGDAAAALDEMIAFHHKLISLN